MPRVPVHTLDDAPDAAQPSLRTLARTMGKLLNIHAEMAHSPVVLAAYTGIQDAIAEHGSFDAATREAIALAVGAVDDCGYCQSAHTLGGKAAGLDSDTMIAVRAGRPTGNTKLDTLLAVVRARRHPRRLRRGHHLEPGPRDRLERRRAQRSLRAPVGEPVHQLLQPLRRHRARRPRRPGHHLLTDTSRSAQVKRPATRHPRRRCPRNGHAAAATSASTVRANRCGRVVSDSATSPEVDPRGRTRHPRWTRSATRRSSGVAPWTLLVSARPLRRRSSPTTPGCAGSSTASPAPGCPASAPRRRGRDRRRPVQARRRQHRGQPRRGPADTFGPAIEDGLRGLKCHCESR